MAFFKRMIIAGLGLSLLSSFALAEQYRILLTNDDGIDNPGLIALAEHLSGTIGAAMEAQYYSIPAIALNLNSAENAAQTQ